MEPLATYEVRTPPGYEVVTGGAVLVTAAAAALLVYTVDHLLHTSIGGRELLLVAMTGLLVLAPVAWYLGTSAYRIGGRRSQIRFFPDRLEVPAAGRRAWVIFNRERLHISAEPQTVRILLLGVPAGQVSRGEVMTLSDGKNTRRLSSQTLADEDWLDNFKKDLERFIAGATPTGSVGARRAQAPRAAAAKSGVSRYEEQLERELSELPD